MISPEAMNPNPNNKGLNNHSARPPNNLSRNLSDSSIPEMPKPAIINPTRITMATLEHIGISQDFKDIWQSDGCPEKRAKDNPAKPAEKKNRMYGYEEIVQLVNMLINRPKVIINIPV